nr:hypothetical protein [Dechloromonas sp.]
MPNSPPDSAWHAYLRWFLATLVALVLLVGAFNILIDPQGVFGSPRFGGLNAIKPYLDHHRELARWQAALRLCASAGIFGNSRAEIGLDPENPLFAAAGLTAFNHAIPGSPGLTAYRQINWLRNAGCMPRTIVLGVEFFDFLGGSKPLPRSAFENPAPPRADTAYLAETVFSIAGLRDSVGTIRLQRAKHPAMLTDRGFNPLYNYIEEVTENGHYVLFRQRANENARNWVRRAPRLRLEEGSISSDEQSLDAALAMASAAGSTAYLVIYPYHAQIRLMIERLGLGEVFAEWKRSVVDLAVNHLGHGGHIEVWDFSGLGPETTEAIPPRGDRRTQLRYYWEAGHFKKELGNLIIGRLLGQSGEFGIRLDQHNIDRWLEEDRLSITNLLAEPSTLRNEVEDVLASTRQNAR